MKTCLKLEGQTLEPVVFLAGLATMMLASVSAMATATPSAAEDAVKSHTLFMGLDVSIERDKTFHPVRDVSGGTFLITVRGEPVFVPTNLRSINLRIDQELKLASGQAVVANLKAERAYTPANDPNLKFAAMAASSAAAAATIDVAGGRINNTEVAVFYAEKSPNPGDLAAAQAAVGDAYGNLASSAFSAGSDMNSVGASAATLQTELAKGLYDAIQVSFEVSSDKPLNNPYVVIVARYREPDARPGAVRNWIYAQSLEPIAEKPRRVHVNQGGFPPGFQLDGYHVHLYDRGTEVATTVASKRVALTREEAFEYLMIEHLSQHKGASVPASPALAELPADFHTRVSGGQIAEPLYVKVSAQGRAEEVFRDQTCTQPLEDEYLGTVVKSFRFKPALEKGKPVESITALRLNQLPL